MEHIGNKIKLLVFRTKNDPEAFLYMIQPYLGLCRIGGTLKHLST